ncbi:hypothetical protein OIT44_02045 [Weissella ceti]|uniref:Uncharacterized protein n=1 Tax=Weissella ceti TaxID=759620 RepID=A0ABT3E349_9LACO|nr:hypothetical protein [Weissella ceti]MCW0952850.1 hypothetical protein [Weissella ceti]QVK12547.1 hypothetical protein KHQ31_02675 [Weissella ceti]
MALLDILTTLIEDLDFEGEDEFTEQPKQSVNHAQQTRSMTPPPSRVNDNHRGAVQPGTASYIAKDGGFGQNKNAKKQYKRLQKGVTRGPGKNRQDNLRIVDQLKPWLTDGVSKP